MNDEKIESHLRSLPTPLLPVSWQREIISTALRAAQPTTTTRQVWPTLLLYLHHLFARNPVTATAMTALWVLIFLFKATTPIDPQEKILLAHLDPNRPVYLVSISDQILLAQLALDQSEQQPLRQIP